MTARRLGGAVLFVLLTSLAGQTHAQTPQPSASPPSQTRQTPAAPPPEQPQAEGRAKAQPPPPPYQLLREDEDWSFLRERSRRADLWDPLKFIRLRGGRDDWYVTLGGEIRTPYYENFRNEDFGGEPEDDNGFFTQRFMLHADFHLGSRVRAFVQLKSGIEHGRVGGPRPVDEDRLDINQLFFDFNFGRSPEGTRSASSPPVGTGPSTGGGDSSSGASRAGGGATSNTGAGAGSASGNNDSPLPLVTLRLGRQELNYGSGRLVSVREGPNVRQGFDGARLIWRPGRWRIDGFAVKPVETDPGFFDDATNTSQTLWGVYAVRPLPAAAKQNIDLYYVGNDRRRFRFDQGAARDIRHSLGVRLSNTGQAFDYDVELTYQLGKFGRGDINAWGVSSVTGYTLRERRFSPRLAVSTGFNTGDRDPRDPALQTFAPPNPRGRYFGLIGANGPSNVRGFQPELTLQLTKALNFRTYVFFFWRDSLRDGFYAVPGTLTRTGQLSRARYIGTQPEAVVTWQIDRHTTFTISYGHFAAGRYLRETPPGRDTDYFSTWLTYKF